MSLGAAIGTARKRAGLSQTVLAERVGVSQPDVSYYERDQQRPPVERIAAIDDACGLPRGTVLRWAGFVDLDCTVEDLLRADADLDERAIATVLGAYRAAKGRRGGRGQHR